MTWVRRAEPPAPKPERHQCTLPHIHAERAQPGDLWRCDTCGDLWRVGVHRRRLRHRPSILTRQWRPARWWQRLRHRDRGGETRYRPEKIRRGGQVAAPNAKEPPVRDRVPKPPKPPADTSWITMEER